MTEPARSFQHYEVLRRNDGTPWELGRGAMGVTYKAFDVNLCCEVALKVVSAALVENPEARERFVREARAAAALRHRNVASVYHLGNDGEHFFYAMEFINGDTLDALVRRGGPLSVENTLRVILQVARALAAAERQHLVHRDIKPANLMVTHEDADEETVVKVIDFGLARTAATAENAPPLTLGGFVGTPQYASPEQLEERPLDARSDIYSLGITAWFLLTGRTPFAGSLATVCQRQLTQPPPWDLLPLGLPICVRVLLGHLLEKDAARRPQNALELRAEIEACLEEIQGAGRKRDLHLPALASAAAAGPGDKAKTAALTLQVGTLLNARYRLLHEIGDRDGVRVFQARDESTADKLVAVKILLETGSPNSSAQNDLAEEVRLIQAAAHPHLARILALEKSKSPATTFVVEEWLAGPTVRDLLATRGGVLSVAETLGLLAQTAAATDHAARCRLERLELTLTAWHLTLTAPGVMAEDGSRWRALLPRSLADWPEWTLKVRAFRFHDDPMALNTWAGGATLVPTAVRPGTAAESSSAPYVQDLARLVYECLGGTPAVPAPGAKTAQTRYASLPILNEEANLRLRQAVTGGGPFTDGQGFYEALVAAIGEDPVRGDARVPVSGPELPAMHWGGLRGDGPVHESTRMELRFADALVPDVVPAGRESVAGFFRDGDGPGMNRAEELLAGSAWDRLSLVGSRRAHPGRWLAGLIGLAAVFVLGFVGVLIWLLQQMPAHAANPNPSSMKRPVVTVTSQKSTPRPATPAPLAAATPVSMPPVASVTALVNTPAPAPTPLPAETASVAVATPVTERPMTVRLESIPSGAQIFMGDNILGTTPCRASLTRGDHELIAHYQNWPETHQTVHIDGTGPHAAVEIRLMRPDLVPGLSPPTESRARHAPAPATHSRPYAETSMPSVRAKPVEPEVRRAERVLTPFRVDVPEAPPSPSPDRQPTPADDSGEN